LTHTRARGPPLPQKKVYTGLVELRPDAIKKQNARKGIRERKKYQVKKVKAGGELLQGKKGIAGRYVTFLNG